MPDFTDPDEDLVGAPMPTRPAVPPVGLPPAAAAPAPPPLPPPLPPAEKPPLDNWRHVGNTYDERTKSGKKGVKRVVEADVEYAASPHKPAWQKSAEQKQTYLLETSFDPKQARSLGDLGRLLNQEQRARRPAPPPKELLDELDNAAQALLAVAQQLHQGGYGVGLLTPDN